MCKKTINNIQLVSVELGQSLFEFTNKYCKQESNDKLLTNKAFHRLCTLGRKMGVNNAVVENILPSANEIKDECEALYIYYNKKINIEAYRITFITQHITSLEQIPSLTDQDFLSSTIVINFESPDRGWITYLYYSIVAVPKIINHPKFSKCGTLPLLNNYLHIYKNFPCEVGFFDGKPHTFHINGTLFFQQNSVTSVCAHASLCMAINNMSSYTGDFITPEYINKIIGVDHKKNKFKFPSENPKEGLTKEEIESILNKCGLKFVRQDFFQAPNIEYNDFIYKFLESRYPVLLIFTTSGASSHIVSVFGHTLNSDLWRPEAEIAYTNRFSYYKPSSAWVDNFIIHDDNFGMYVCMPVEALKRITLPKYDKSFRAVYALALRPKEVETSAEEAEAASAYVTHTLFKTMDKLITDVWTKRLFNFNKFRPFVIRTLCVSKEEYKKSMEKTDFEGNSFSVSDKTELLNNLPNIFWLSELTLPDLYTANKSKIIDFFYSCNYPEFADSEQDFLKRWIQVRFPSKLIKNSDPLSYRELQVKSHYPLFRMSTEQETLDW